MLEKRIKTSVFKIQERDILAELLADKRSENTRKAYQKDLVNFFQSIASSPPTPELLKEFLTLERFTATGLVLQYKAELIQAGLKEATVNRRLASIKSLVRYAGKIGKCDWSLEEVSGEKIKTYRDTSGIGIEQYKKMLAVPNRNTLRGKRDYAILHLLWSNVLRVSEVCNINVSDYNFAESSLWILGKGKGTQKERVSLSSSTNTALEEWLVARGDELKLSDPLFIAVTPQNFNHRLSTDAIADIVKKYAKKAGVKKHLSPHRIRHSGITYALDATNGNVRKVQKLSRHVKLETLMLYDDNRASAQAEITNLISRDL